MLFGAAGLSLIIIRARPHNNLGVGLCRDPLED